MLKRISRLNYHHQRAITREVIVPGALMIGLVCLIRFSGVLQTQEWMALDTFSRHCPSQGEPGRLTLVSVDESDYQTTGFPISADILAQALTNLQTYQPRVIGLDIFRDLPQGQGQDMLKKVLASMPNVVAAEVALSPEPMMNVDAPAGIPPEQVGFADSIVDQDGKLRRIVLAIDDESGVRKNSLALLLARQYLRAENIELDTMALLKFHPNSGGYSRAAVNGTQMLMNFCMRQTPYETVSLSAVLNNQIEADKIRDRIVLIGKTATNAKDSFITSAVSQTLYSQQVGSSPRPTQIIYGVEVHGHATEQIVGSAMGMKCALQTWIDVAEYLWIVAWGLLGMTLSILLRSPWKSICALIVTTLLLSALSYHLLLQSVWVPVVPAILALCGAGLTTAFFDRDMRFELAQRRATIERTYEAVHSGPLQRLADITRSVQESSYLTETVLTVQLQRLNDEMRSIFANMRRDATPRAYSLHLNDATFLDLQAPISDLLYQVYEHTIAQSLPGFEQIQTYIPPDFEPLTKTRLGVEEKRGLCLFVQEALLNVGKHATGATRLEVACLYRKRVYRLQVIDDGLSPEMRPVSRQGTYQARAIARRLNGRFQRKINRSEYNSSPYPMGEKTIGNNIRDNKTTNGNISTRGTTCELIWPR